ncbi:MAG TPA: hypothetical protein VF777_00355 [Phycisphaerales bacterium]
MMKTSEAFDGQEHRADFAARAFGVVQKRDELVCRTSLEAFGDVVADRHDRSLQLIANVANPNKGWIVAQREHFNGDVSCCIPHGNCSNREYRITRPLCTYFRTVRCSILFSHLVCTTRST